MTEKLRSDERTRWIPILVITGVDYPRKEVESLLAGVDDYLRKPFDEEVLRAARRGAAAGRGRRVGPKGRVPCGRGES